MQKLRGAIERLCTRTLRKLIDTISREYQIRLLLTQPEKRVEMCTKAQALS